MGFYWTEFTKEYFYNVAGHYSTSHSTSIIIHLAGFIVTNLGINVLCDIT